MNQDLKLTPKKKTFFGHVNAVASLRKDRSKQSTSEIQRKLETRFYLRLCT